MKFSTGVFNFLFFSSLSFATAFSPFGNDVFLRNRNVFRLEAVSQKEAEGATVGDTKGAALLVENVAISRGANRILGDVNLRIERRQRWGIVGPVSLCNNRRCQS
jgi:hypothetical protein